MDNEKKIKFNDEELIEEVTSEDELLTFADKYISGGKKKGVPSKGMASASRIIPARISKDLEIGRYKVIEKVTGSSALITNYTGILNAVSGTFETSMSADEIKKLVNVLNDKANEFSDVIKMGRTHLQEAVPMTIGQQFKGYSRY